jgi:hypothetical protein
MAAFLVDVTMGRIERAPGLERTGIALARRVGFQNVAVVPDRRLQAAVSYSLMRPPKIGRHRILP